MFEMTPFERTYRNVFGRNPFADLDKDFFGNQMSTITDFQTDVQDTGDAFLLEADLPGFDKKDISIDIHDHRLTIKAVRHLKVEEKDKKKNYIRQERSYGSFTRTFEIDGIDENKITAAYTDGVLKLTLPKLIEQKPISQKITIE